MLPTAWTAMRTCPRRKHIPALTTGQPCRTLKLLVDAAHACGVTHITLESTEMGRKLYETFGFLPLENEMILPD